MYIDTPQYEDIPRVDGWLKWLLITISGLLIVLAIALLFIDRLGSVVILAVAVIDGLLFYSIIPRRYQIYSDRLKTVLGGPFSMTFYYKGFLSIKRVEGGCAWASSGIRLATSSRYVIEISRQGKLSVIISPSGGDVFFEQINQAWKSYLG